MCFYHQQRVPFSIKPNQNAELFQDFSVSLISSVLKIVATTAFRVSMLQHLTDEAAESMTKLIETQAELKGTNV